MNIIFMGIDTYLKVVKANVSSITIAGNVSVTCNSSQLSSKYLNILSSKHFFKKSGELADMLQNNALQSFFGR